MRRFFDITGIVGIAIGVTLLLMLNFSVIQSETLPATGKKTSPPGAILATGKSFRVDFEVDDETLRKFTDRERRDQQLDWLLVGILSSRGLSPKEMGQCLYDLPSIRLGYTRPVANFEFGETRSRVVGNGVVVALIPAADGNGKERKDHLARIADEQKKNLGEIPEAVEIYEYRIDPTGLFATITPRGKLKGRELFTEAYGYYEKSISTLDDLTRFMRSTDDLTFARLEGKKLRFGGRKILARKYRNIGVEDVAALWRAAHEADQSKKAFYDKWEQKRQALIKEWDEKQREFKDKWGKLLQNLDSRSVPLSESELRRMILEERAQLEEGAKKAFEEWSAQAQEDYLQQHIDKRLVDHLGFSLDPKDDFDSLKPIFTNVLEPLLLDIAKKPGSPISAADVKDAKDRIDKKETLPYIKLIHKLRSHPDPNVALAGQAIGRLEAGLTFKTDGPDQSLDMFAHRIEPLLLAIAKKRDSPISEKDVRDAMVALKKKDRRAYNKLLKKLVENKNPVGFALMLLGPEAPMLGAMAKQEPILLVRPSLLAFAKQSGSPITEEAVKRALAALRSGNPVPYRALVDKLKASRDQKPRELGNALDLLTHGVRFQVARYDGKLKGTEVGMILFYTDLLAKLWAMDYVGSTPSENIPDFVAMTERKISLIHREESTLLPSTRLWFGQHSGGVCFTEGKDSLAFARIATRVYAASSNPLKPGVEEPPNASSAAFLNWWNDHYAEVAAYEPQYQRLNEIMKWSLLLRWLQSSENLASLGFLADMQVTNSHWFPEWAKNTGDLKFGNWTQVGFFPPGHRGATTEAMRILRSKPHSKMIGSVSTLEGGVSLALPKTFEKMLPAPKEMSKPLRRSNLDYESSSPTGKSLKRRDSVSYQVESPSPDRATIIARKAKKSEKDVEPKFRGTLGEIGNTQFEYELSRKGERTSISAKAGDNPLGDLDIVPTEKGLKMAWKARDVDAGHSLAGRVSRSSNPDKMLVESPEVEAAIRLEGPDQIYLVRQRQGNKWVKMALSDKPTAELEAGYDSRVADPNRAKRIVKLAWLTEAQARSMIDGESLIVIERPKGASETICTLHPTRGPPPSGKPIRLKVGDNGIDGWVDLGGLKVYLPAKEVMKLHDVPLKRRLKLVEASELETILELAAGNKKSVEYEVPSHRVAGLGNLAGPGEGGKHRDFARKIATDPEHRRRTIEEGIQDKLVIIDRYQAEGNVVRALRQIDEVTAHVGSRPDLAIRKAILLLEIGRTREAAKQIGLKIGSKDPGYEQVFNETYKHLSTSNLSREQKRELLAVAKSVEHNHRAKSEKALSGEATVLMEGKKRLLALLLRFPFKGRAITDAESIPKGKELIVYVRDGSKLSERDWSPPSLRKTLAAVITAKEGKVKALPTGPLNTYRPDAAILSGVILGGIGSKTSVKFKLESEHNVTDQMRWSNPSRDGQNCDDDDDCYAGDSVVLFVQ